MRNHITHHSFDLSDVAIELRQAPRVAVSEPPRAYIRDERGDATGGRENLPGTIVTATSEFEGFGSFSG